MREQFEQIGTEFTRGLAESSDHGFIPKAMGYKNPGPTPNLRGVESNTARGVKGAPEIMGITSIEYGSSADAPEVTPFKTYGE